MSAKTKMTKSVFLYGYPTKVKKEAVYNTQREYLQLINFFIKKLMSDKRFYLNIFNNNSRSPSVRQLEKDHRHTHQLGSAYGQNAIDEAVTHLHNHFKRIKNNLYGYVINNNKELLPYVSFTSLLNASILNIDELYTLELLIRSASKKDAAIYESVLKKLSNFTDEERSSNRSLLKDLFLEKLENWKKPYIKNTPVQLDTRVSKLEVSTDTKEDFVVSVKLIGVVKRVKFPVSTSKNSIRRMLQYKTGSLSMSLVGNKVRFTVPFEKKISKKEQSELLGVDLGYTDLFFTSSNNRYGTFTDLVDKYNEKLEVKLGNRSSLRNKRREYQKRLQKSSCLKEKEFLRRKIKNISDNLNNRKTVTKARRAYQYMIDFEISKAVKSLFNEIKKNGYLPVFEDLEIRDFNLGRKANKRNSLWVRGKLIDKITEILDWNGYTYKFVDPAYTSKACSKCDNISDSNRKGKKFICTVCKFTADADYNASINIKKRALDKEIQEITELYSHSKEKRHKALRRLLKERHRSALSLVS